MASRPFQWPENPPDSGERQVEVGEVILMSIFHNNCIVMFMDECSCLSDGFGFDSNRFEWMINQKYLSERKTQSLVHLT